MKPSELPVLKLKRGPGRPRVLAGHPWVYANELEALPDAAFDGLALSLRDQRGRSLGSGIYNSRSQIAWRRFSRADGIPFDMGYLADALQEAVGRRAEEPCRRLVWSDADYIPGLIVDQFDELVVVQAVTKAVETQLDEICNWFAETLEPADILLRNDAPVREREGLESYVRTHSGRTLEPRWVDIDGLEYELDLANSQKTGFYLDQREQHGLVASLAEGRRVLDGFCNQGAFGLQAAKAGAEEVTCVDSSADCIEAVRRNAARNECTVEAVEANMFDTMKALEPGAFDLIVLDPPSFARNRKSVAGALRGYKELNLRAFQSLPSGGILATYCCSQHVSATEYEQVVASAAADAGREARLFARTGQPFDHPVRINFPESEYLKGLIYAVE